MAVHSHPHRRRGLAVLLPAVVAMPLILGSALLTVPNASAGGSELLVNGGFESGRFSGWARRNATIVTTSPHGGAYEASIASSSTDFGTLEQTVTGLSPNTAYVLTGWVRTSGQETRLGAKGFGGSQVTAPVNSNGWQQASVPFTTSSTASSVTVFCYLPKRTSGTSRSWCDDLSLTAAPGPSPTPTLSPTPTPTPTISPTPTPTPTSTPTPNATGPRTAYVDCAAPANGDGSQAWPLNSVAAVNALTLSPGDSVLFKGGVLCNGSLVAGTSGTATSPITYGTYAGGRGRIEANGAADAVLVRNAAHVVVQDLELSAGGNGTAPRRGVHLQATDAGTLPGVILQRLDIHDVRGVMPSTTGGDMYTGKMSGASGGIIVEALGSTTPTAYSGLKILDNTIRAVDRQGIYIWSNWCIRADLNNVWRNTFCSAPFFPHTGIVIRGNTLSDIGGDGIAPMTSTNGLVENNTLAGYNRRAKTYNAGMWTANSDDMLFQRNDTSGGISTLDGMSYDVDHSTNRVTFQYNVSHDNEGGFLLICPKGWTVPGHARDFVIRYNLSVNDHFATLQLCGGGAERGQIHNNTIVLPTGENVTLGTEPAAENNAVQIAWSNNVFYRAPGSIGSTTWSVSDSSWTGTNNVFFNVSSMPNSAGSLTSNPLLVNPLTAYSGSPGSYRPQAGSPVIGSGAPLAGAPASDFFGTPLGSSISRGFAQN